MTDRERGLVRTDREGIALLVVVLLTMVVAAIASGAALIGANSFLINQYDQKVSLLESVADGGLELGRARLNANPALFPTDSGFVTLDAAVSVQDAMGSTIDGITRSVYAGPVGGGPGEYGSFGAVIAVAEDADGVRVVRRMDLLQSSFAAYAYFTDVEPSTIAFGNNDKLYGPVHSNSNIKIRETGATFHGPVTTAGVFEGAQYATFLDDTLSQATPILMPTSSQLTRLHDRATPGHMAFSATAGGTSGQSTMRIHFISRDVDMDGIEEGFIRVYHSPKPEWVSGNIWYSSAADYATQFANTRNCGHYEDNGRFNIAASDTAFHPPISVLSDDSDVRCFLGGADELWKGEFTPVDTWGQWMPYPGTVHPDVADEDDGDYLFPLDRELNPGFRGVIYVSGKVVVSGTVRARVTVAASGNIIIGDDIVYHTNPGSGTCTDMLGLFSGAQIVIANNTLNAPRQKPDGSGGWLTYDESRDEHIHGALLALDQITAESPGSGSTSAQPCDGTAWGRGCLYVTGGLIQKTRGAVSSGGAGYLKRYTHDTCAFTDPPPYFPTTGHFSRSRYYEVDPSGLDVAAYFRALN